MNTKNALRLGLQRLLILLVISVAFILVISETAFALQREEYDRPAKEIELVIPAGSAERVAAGEAVPSIPEEMVFVVGDTLVVKNEDVVDHELGPLWVPAGTSGRLLMEEENKYAFPCSFQTARFLNMDVRQPTNLGARFTAILLAAPPLTLFFFVYSILIWPLQGRQPAK
jgi:hypothetical protein